MPKRGQTGLQKKTISLDPTLAEVVGKREGEKISPLELNKGLNDYLRAHDLVVDGWTVRLDDRLSAVTGLRAGSAIDRRELLSRLWHYIRAHGLKEEGNPGDDRLDRAFALAKKEAKRRGMNFSGWDAALIAGAVIVALLLLLKPQGQPQPQPQGETVAPNELGLCPSGYFLGTDGLCHRA